jgi:hypothetical protein
VDLHRQTVEGITFKLISLIFVTLTLTHAQTQISSRQLIGRWEAVNRSRGGLGSVFTVLNDSLCVVISGVLGDGTYRTKGDSLYRSMSDTPTKELAVLFNISGDSMIHRFPGRPERIVMRRIANGSTSPSAIQGLWFYQHYTRTTAFEEYTPNGQFHFRIDVTSDSSKYVLTGDTLTIHRTKPTANISQCRIAVTDTSLSMFQLEETKPRVFQRARRQ